MPTPAPKPPAPMSAGELHQLAADFQELNLGNYDADDVAALNQWGIDVVGAIAARPVGPVGWRDIGSAPKDGTEVLLWWPHWSKRPVVGHRIYQGCWECDRALHHNAEGPTHWMPLPPPPAAPPVESRRKEVLDWAVRNAEATQADKALSLMTKLIFPDSHPTFSDATDQESGEVSRIVRVEASGTVEELAQKNDAWCRGKVNLGPLASGYCLLLVPVEPTQEPSGEVQS